ncbi:MAG: monovalent cation/H+ antiporter complex subunit F [Armatimonadota bacterium]|nr:monovalent cation/H+ antiporter complex subunit F [Armatimonadota bacterium]MDR5696593.1 monovalent cation/H+ antiporter complex subunit F [Armatimonadota bacterium]
MIAEMASVALVALHVAVACCVAVLALGPDFADRVVATDTLVLALINIVVTVDVLVGTRHFLDVAVVLAALSFVATIAAAQFIHRGGPLA